MGTSVLHIKTEVECRVYLFDEEKGIAKPGTYFNLEVRKGEQDLLFVSTEDDNMFCSIEYDIEECDRDYRMVLEASLFTNYADEASDEDIDKGIEDEYGVLYSRDGSQLLKCNNTSLENYNVKDQCKVIRGKSFYGCKKLASVTLPINLTHIGDYSFLSCNNLSRITLTEKLKYVGVGAFRDCCSLSIVNLPTTLNHIGHGAFIGTRIRTIVNDSPNFIFDKGCLIEVTSKKLIAFLSDLPNVVLPDGLTHIGDYAFSGCDNLCDVTLPFGLTNIGCYAFGWCKNLSVINLPSSLTHIGDCAFYLCEKLSSINIPNSLTFLGNHVFDTCKSITSITLPVSMAHIGEGAFDGCESLSNINLPTFVGFWGDYVFRGCKSLYNIDLPVNLTRTGEGTFINCKNLSCIIFPASITHIEDCSFDGCENLSNITFPASLTHIGCYAFGFCKNLSNISLPDALSYIGQDAFFKCINLSSINLPTSLSHIGDGAFAYTGIRNVVNNSSNFIFSNGCLIDIKNNRLIAYLADEQNIIIPFGVTHIGSGSFNRCKKVANIILPASITHIKDWNYESYKLLDNIFIPRGMRLHFEKLIPKELHSKLNEESIHRDGKAKSIVSRFLFFDTETTGVPRDYKAPASNTRNWPRLVQLGWIVTDEEGNVLSQGNEIVKPEGFVIPADAARVHGITTERAQREGKPLREVIEAFLKDAEQTKCIVGHNISFDQKVVGAELYRLGIPDTISTARSLCTMQAGTDYCKIPGYYGYKWPKLQELYHKLFGCDFEDAHDAMADITATKKCFFEMRKRGLI